MSFARPPEEAQRGSQTDVATANLLSVTNLHVHFVARDRNDTLQTARALNGVNLSVDEGQILGLVGETGAGKSLTALAIMRLLRAPARQVEGTIHFEGQDLAALSEHDMNRVRGDRITLVVQSPKTSLDPLTRVGEQIARLHRVHRSSTRHQAREKALQALASVGIPDVSRRALAWPHELSGGMAQRVLIAMALVNDPRFVIADEPTTGLDVTVQAQILDLLREKVAERRLAAILITHDLGVVANYCDTVAVMFAGTIVETGTATAVFETPRHPYTQHLIGSSPDRITLGQAVRRAGPPPDLYALPSGCPYSDRCPIAKGICATPAPRVDYGHGHAAFCHFAETP
jgi:oligopeptide/dipeptide ABC transporter ATP-binding protein